MEEVRRNFVFFQRDLNKMMDAKSRDGRRSLNPDRSELNWFESLRSH